MDEVGDRAAGGELLGAGDHDAVVALLDHAGIERRDRSACARACCGRSAAGRSHRRHRGGCRACARRTRPRCRRTSGRPPPARPASPHSRRRSRRRGRACVPSGRTSPPPRSPRTAAARADRRGCAGSGRRAAPARRSWARRRSCARASPAPPRCRRAARSSAPPRGRRGGVVTSSTRSPSTNTCRPSLSERR